MTNTTEYKSESMVERGPGPRVKPEDVEAVFQERDDVAEPLTATEIGEALDCSRRTALNRLDDLEASDAVESKKVGGRAKVWWVRKEREQVGFEAADLRGDPETTLGDVETDDASKTIHAAVYEEGGIFPDLRDRLPDGGSNHEYRIKAVRDIHGYLKKHGRGKKSDFEAVVDWEAAGFESFASFWTNCIITPGVLPDLPGVEAPGEGGHTYRHVEDGD